jgi:hypothetical protein
MGYVQFICFRIIVISLPLPPSLSFSSFLILYYICAQFYNLVQFYRFEND